MNIPLEPAGGLTPHSFQPADLVSYARHLQRSNTTSIGFLPQQALEEYGKRGCIIPATENDELCSFLLFFDGPAGKRPRNDPYDLRIIQTCTDYDVRRLKHATYLLNQLIDFGHANGYHRIRLWCADDLPANDFWQTCGFSKFGNRIGGDRRNRVHNGWELPIVDQPSKSQLIESATFLNIPT